MISFRIWAISSSFHRHFQIWTTMYNDSIVPMIHANPSSSTDLRGLKNDFCLVIQFDYKNIQAIKRFVKHSTKFCCATCCWLPTFFKCDITQITFTCSKSTIETLIKGAECLKLIINTSEWRQWRRLMFKMIFEYILHLFLVFLFVDLKQVNVSSVNNVFEPCTTR